MNCPFYGQRQYITLSPRAERSFLLLACGGNQCALEIAAQSPCFMERHGQAIDWKLCPLVTEICVGRIAEAREENPENLG